MTPLAEGFDEIYRAEADSRTQISPNSPLIPGTNARMSDLETLGCPTDSQNHSDLGSGEARFILQLPGSSTKSIMD